MASYRLPAEYVRECHTRGAIAERVRQPGEALHRRGAVPGSSDAAHAAVLQSVPTTEPVFRDGQCLRASAPAASRGRCRILIDDSTRSIVVVPTSGGPTFADGPSDKRTLRPKVSTTRGRPCDTHSTTHGVDRRDGGCRFVRSRIPSPCSAPSGCGRRHDDGARAVECQRRRRTPRILDEAVRCQTGHGRQARRRHHPRRGGSVSPAAPNRTERGDDDQSHGLEAEQAV